MPTLAATIEHESQLKFPCLASPKLDGIRALGSTQGLLNRTLKPIPNLAIQEGYQKALSLYPQLSGLVGELVIAATPNQEAYWLDEQSQLQSGLASDYNNNLSVIMSADKYPASPTWVVFDSYSDADQESPYLDRYQLLREQLKRDLIVVSMGYSLGKLMPPERSSIACFQIKPLKQTKINNLEELQAYEEAQLLAGYKGTMLRHPGC
jgi:DNA ligase-1